MHDIVGTLLNGCHGDQVVHYQDDGIPQGDDKDFEQLLLTGVVIEVLLDLHHQVYDVDEED